MTAFDSITVYALLSGTWTDITNDVQSGLDARWGINGYSRKDLLADIGEMRFKLKNYSGEYYPDGTSPLSGWGANVSVKIVFTYAGISYTRFLGYVDKDGLNFEIGKASANDFVNVTATDWIDDASKSPIVGPNIETDKTADEAIRLLLDYVPQSVSFSGDTGDNTFPSVFDSVGLSTTAYMEFSKLAYSESPGYIYLIKHRDTGERLVFENASHRDTSHAQSQVATLAYNYWLNHSSGNFKNHSGGIFKRHNVTETGAANVTLSSEIDGIKLNYGGNVVNRATVTAYPKRVDTNLQTLYRLPSALAIANGETITFRAKYTDPLGGGRVNAIVESMIAPEAPGAADPTLMTLLNFTTDPITDETGRHSWAQNDLDIWNDVYADGFGTVYISGGVLGSYAVFGGYSAYWMETVCNEDFNFYDQPFTIGWYENKLETTSENVSMSSDLANPYPPIRLGYVNGDSSNVQIHMSSDGATWDIANGKSLGQVKVGSWVYYEVSRDSTGWFYAFADGRLTDSWYSSLAFPSNYGYWSLGRTYGGNYCYMGFDSFFIRKGVCLHKTDFEPPKIQINATSDGDYRMNTLEDGSGTDLSDSLAITAVYSSEAIDYTLTNNSGSDGFITYLRARGLGVYLYDSIEETAEDTTSQAAYRVQPLSVSQKYQQDIAVGKAWMDDIITDEKDPVTRLQSVSFWANYSASNMLYFLQCDVGDLIRVTSSRYGVDDYFYIQNVSFKVVSGGLVYATWGVVPGKTPA